MRSWRSFEVGLIAWLLTGCLASPVLGKDDVTSMTGTWRFTHATAAPWGAPLVGGANLTGQTLILAAHRMQGPVPLNCGAAQLEATAYPAEGLFQGGLSASADKQAQNLGLAMFPVAGLRVSCDKGLFEFHQADPDTLLLGLDNRVWSLSRAPGVLSKADSPAGRVERLLESHFGGGMGFDAGSASTKASFQSKRLNQRIAAYLARPRPQDEVPPINGDPYTDSQEYPTRFAVGAAQIRKDRARVPVRYSDAWSQRTINFELVRAGGVWQVDDLDYGPGGRLSTLLSK
jgi:hypothetical protein